VKSSVHIFRILVTVYLLQSHWTIGLQHPEQSERRGPGRCSNVVKNMLKQIFEGPTPGKLLGKLDPFEKFWSSGKEEARPGGDIVKKGRKLSPTKQIV